MNEIDANRYDYLRTKRYVVHEEHEQFIRPETLAEMREYEVIEFYSRERIRELIQQGLDDTVHHNCVHNQCVLPESAMPDELETTIRNDYANNRAL